MLKTTLVLAAATSCALASEGTNIFDDGHDFMKGFETGVITRGKDVLVSEYGCQEISRNTELDTIFGFVDMALNGVQPFLPDDFELINGFKMVRMYADNVIDLLSVLQNSSTHTDHYCRGLIFGRIGSQGIADIALFLRSQDLSDLELVPSKDGKTVKR